MNYDDIIEILRSHEQLLTSGPSVRPVSPRKTPPVRSVSTSIGDLMKNDGIDYDRILQSRAPGYLKNELIAFARRLGLSLGGTKDQLIERIIQHHQQK